MGDLAIWSDSHKYTVTTVMTGRRCITPILKEGGRQCKRQLDEGSVEQLLELHNEVMRSINANDIVRKMLQLVLVRCNELCRHRDILASRPECHRAVAERYLEAYANLKLLRINVPSGLVVENEDSIEAGKLIPFVPQSQESLKVVLTKSLVKVSKDINKTYTKVGVVYAFTSSAWLDVVKIGYSGVSAQSRMDALRKCMPDGKKAIEMSFEFPERIEQLIHLELLGQRRKVVRCKTCSRGHEEFFEVSVDKVRKLFEEWQRITKDESLYDAEALTLTESWQQRLKALSVDATVWELGKVLDMEERAKIKQQKMAKTKVEKEKQDVAKAKVEIEKQEREKASRAKQEKAKLEQQQERKIASRAKQEDTWVEEQVEKVRADAVRKKAVLPATLPLTKFALSSKDIVQAEPASSAKQSEEFKQVEVEKKALTSANVVQSQAIQHSAARATESSLAWIKTEQSALPEEGPASASIILKKVQLLGGMGEIIGETHNVCQVLMT